MTGTCTKAGEYPDQAYEYDPASGNLHSKTGLGDYNYDSTQPHAVDSVTGWEYTYDANGNMTRRDPTGVDVYDYVYDSENRLVQAKKNNVVIATMTYDGDGNRVKAVLGTTTTAFVGGYYEVTGGVITKYYSAGGTRIAMMAGSTFNWLFTDHLSSTSVIANATGGLQDRILYKAWGEVRYPSGSLGTRYTYTGQYTYATSGANDFGLMYYGARWYDPLLSRWAQPDSIVPGDNGAIVGQSQNSSIVPLTVDFHEQTFLLQLNQENAFTQQHGPWFQLSTEEKQQAKNPFGPTNPQLLDRYAYVLNNPLKYSDPTGHNESGGNEDFGYESEDPNEAHPGLTLYKLWNGDQVIYVYWSDFTKDLISQFIIAAKDQARAKNDMENALQDLLEKGLNVFIVTIGFASLGHPVCLGISALALIGGGYFVTKDAENFVQAWTNWQTQKAIASSIWGNLSEWSYYP